MISLGEVFCLHRTYIYLLFQQCDPHMAVVEPTSTKLIVKAELLELSTSSKILNTAKVTLPQLNCIFFINATAIR